MQMIKADANIGKRMVRSEKNEIVHRNWRATDALPAESSVYVREGSRKITM